VYRDNNASPIERDEAINNGNDGLTRYFESKIMQARQNVIKKGSDTADECNSISDADDKKNRTAHIAVKNFFPAAK